MAINDIKLSFPGIFVTIDNIEIKPFSLIERFNHSYYGKIAKRLLDKYRLGFTEVYSFYNGFYNITYKYIGSPIPDNDIKFLTFLHELGHATDKFLTEKTCEDLKQIFASTGVYPEEYKMSELKAWELAFKRLRRMKLLDIISQENLKIIDECLDSYQVSIDIREKLYNKFGLSMKRDFSLYGKVPLYEVLTSSWGNTSV